MELYAITVEGDRTRVRQTRQGPGRGTTHIVDLLSGAVVATAATFCRRSTNSNSFRNPTRYCFFNMNFAIAHWMLD